jgi:hypothetical protein
VQILPSRLNIIATVSFVSISLNVAFVSNVCYLCLELYLADGFCFPTASQRDMTYVVMTRRDCETPQRSLADRVTYTDFHTVP